MSCAALILAGGRGTRLKPYTDIFPKPLLPLLGTPLIGRAVNSLCESGITEINIVGHYNFQAIEDYFKANQAPTGVNLNLAGMDRLRGTAYTLKSLKNPPETVIVYYGDIVLDRRFSWQQFLQAHGSNSADVTILYKRAADVRTYGVLDLQDGMVARIREKPFLGWPDAVAGNINGAVYLLSRRTVEHAVELLEDVDDPDNTKNDFMRNIFPLLLTEGFTIKGFDLGDGFWISIDHPEHYRQVFLDYLRGALDLEITRSYEEIDAAGSWGHGPFLRELGEKDLLPPFREYFSSAFRPAAQSRDKRFLDRLALLRNLLGVDDLGPFIDKRAPRQP